MKNAIKTAVRRPARAYPLCCGAQPWQGEGKRVGSPGPRPHAKRASSSSEVWEGQAKGARSAVPVSKG